MADHTAIEWTDATWNPVTGCTKVSPGCDHCYAETFAERFRGVPGHYFEQGFDIVIREDKLDQPLRWTKPRRIFVNSMSDLFHQDVPDEYLDRVFDVMEQARQHTFQVLTKRHARLRSYVRARMEKRWEYADKFEHCPTPPMQVSPAAADARLRAITPPANIWLGVSVENQHWADIRVPALLDTPAAVRFLSCEPLLGPVDLWRSVCPHALDWRRSSTVAPHHRDCCDAAVGQLDWVIVGGESGRNTRPMHPDWARSLRDQCQAAQVPYLFKQWGEHGPLPKVLPGGRYATDPGVTIANDGTVYQPGDLAWPDGPRTGEAIRLGHDKANLHAMYRVGKKTAGRELDGRTWDEFPAERAAVTA